MDRKNGDIHEEFFYPDDILEEPKYKETMVFYQKNDKWGMISIEGHTSIAPVYDNLYLHGEYYIAYKAQKGHALDMNGEVVTSSYDDIDVVEGGFIVANGGKYGYISKNNKILIEPKYYLIDAIDDDKLIVITDDSKYGLYNQNGKKLLPEIYEYIWGKLLWFSKILLFWNKKFSFFFAKTVIQSLLTFARDFKF